MKITVHNWGMDENQEHQSHYYAQLYVRHLMGSDFEIWHLMENGWVNFDGTPLTRKRKRVLKRLKALIEKKERMRNEMYDDARLSGGPS